ncbi:hypothetical protein C8J57DRAFT_1435424 [Mycena rebaudengoi]|nr:hypothetical protein C8J57DRAFT_1435424 [Mycena rebaudengoi]
MVSDKHPCQIAYDGVSHHALGGGSYAYKDNYVGHLTKLISGGPQVVINVIIQPNSSPHFGTLLNLCLADRLRVQENLEPLVIVDLLDNAKSEELEIDGVIYQRGLRETGKLFDNLPDYLEVLGILKTRFHVDFKSRMEKEFLSEERIPAVIRTIISQRAEIGRILSPSSGILAPRAPCPHKGCGLVDKYAVHNEYDEEHDIVNFQCPRHGKFPVAIATECHRFQFNAQLFSLVFARFYELSPSGYIQISGSDYAGFWQEQMILRQLSRPILIVYCPLIVDWSGNKLSKSIYLQKSGYNYLTKAKLGYMLSYKTFKEQNRDLNVLMDEVELWIDEPYRLFRAYSVHYFHMLFDHKQKLRLGGARIE